jgi:hypothetical protein
MGLFGPTREEKRTAAAWAVEPLGFVMDPSRADQLRPLMPLAELYVPDRFVTAAFGRIEDADVAAFEYEYSSADSEGTSYSYTLVIAVAHPKIAGAASLSPERREWDTAAAVIDAITWIPPFILVKAFQLINESRNPDRTIGHEEFDKLYVVHAASDEAAREAITPELRDLLPRIGFRGTLEIRPGLLLYTVVGTNFDFETLPQALGYAAPLLAATVHRAEYPYR